MEDREESGETQASGHEVTVGLMNPQPLQWLPHTVRPVNSRAWMVEEHTGSTLICDWQLMAAKRGRVSFLQRRSNCSGPTAMDMSCTKWVQPVKQKNKTLQEKDLMKGHGEGS